MVAFRFVPFVLLTALALCAPTPAQCRTHVVGPANGLPEQSFGFDVDLENGLALVGAPATLGGVQLPGAAYLLDAATGQTLFELAPGSTATKDYFGYAVDLDGGYALVGAREASPSGPASGSAHVFDVTTGQELFELTASDGVAGDRFGGAVAAHSGRAVVGTYFANNYSGAAYVYDLATGTELFELASQGKAFGGAVDISKDYILVGAFTTGTSETGGAYVFEAATGALLHTLVPSDGGAGDFFGYSVAIVGHRAVVGAHRNQHSGLDEPGAVYVFDLATGIQRAKVRAPDAEAFAAFGGALDGDGNTAHVLITCQGDDLVGTNHGSVYLYDLDAERFVYEFGTLGGDALDKFSRNVAIDGTRALAGAHYQPLNGPFSGAAHFFDLLPGQSPGSSYCGPANANSTGLPAEIFAWGTDVASDNCLVLGVRQLPPDQFTYLLASETQSFVPHPGGSEGNLCLGGKIGRFVHQVRLAGPGGVLHFQVDLSAIPTTPKHAVLAGETWNFQAWFRDGKTSNFTDAQSVSFL